jgi:hypothetical protein
MLRVSTSYLAIICPLKAPPPLLPEMRPKLADDILGWREEIEREIRKSMPEWRRQGAARFLLRQLRKRFGELPEAVTARVSGAPMDQIESWADQLVDGANPNALFGEIL